MIISSSLGIIPFISSTDSTRLQMAAKQLSQTVTHNNCRRPYVIGDQYNYMGDTSKLYKLTADVDGQIIYIGHNIMIVFFNDNESSYLKVFEIPKFKHCANSFATELRNCREEGEFKKGDILFEYNGFIENVPSYGYNLNVAYMPWFGLNFEDAVVISESASKLMKSNKIESLILPVYKDSLFRNTYPDSKFGFLPEEGQKINDNVVLYQAVPKNNANKKQLYGSINLYELTTLAEDNFLFNSIPLISKLPGGVVSKIKVHYINKSHKMIDKSLERKIKSMLKEYYDKCEDGLRRIHDIFGQKYALEIFSQHYRMVESKQEKIPTNELIYIIELEIQKEYDTKIGDKLSNR